jgi:hypothetical protein
MVDFINPHALLHEGRLCAGEIGLSNGRRAGNPPLQAGATVDETNAGLFHAN